MSKKKTAIFSILLFVLLLSFSGVCSAQWKNVKGGTKYYDSAAKEYVADSWKKINKKWYYFDAKGYLKTGRFKVGDKYYYAKRSTGRYTQKLAGVYYYGKDGAMVKNCWKTVKKKTYYFGANGKMRTGRFTVGQKTYYSTKKTGCVKKKRVGDYYYNADGVMVKNRWVNNYYYGKNGKARYGKFEIGGETYCCLKKSGKVTNRWYNKNFYDEDGVMATNCWIGSGDNAAYVDASGRITKGNKNPLDPPSNEDIRLLAALTYWEAGNQPYEGKVAVASVVVNRLQSSRFPNTLRGVIFQEGQFTPAMDGRVDALARGGAKIQSECVKAARLVLTEGSKYKGYFYFNGAGGTIKIGDHWFS